jgi:hypothetical protein
MTINPYESPREEARAVGVKSGRREDLKSIAKRQKGILVCILIYLIAMFAQLGLPPDLQPVLSLVVLVVAIVGMVYVFLLSIKVYHPVVGVVLTLVMLVPCVGLLALLVVNGKATSVLRANGYRVGLMGARMSDF